jgi:hypothetical protein
MQHGNRKRILGGTIDRLADHVSPLVPVEGRIQYLDLEVGFAARNGIQMGLDTAQDVLDIPIQILEFAAPAEIEEHLPY